MEAGDARKDFGAGNMLPALFFLAAYDGTSIFVGVIVSLFFVLLRVRSSRNMLTRTESDEVVGALGTR